ncbi:MAG: integrase core domain-containing protein [Anaerolineae bacterium]|nr:integrase core domain-containing protein [Anaerolineae bacterium]
MVWFLVSQIFSTLIALIQIGRMSESDKDLEIMVLRYQLGIAERKLKKPVRANRAERLTLAVLAGRLKQQTGRPANQFRQLIRLVQPETVFRWHRDLVRRKWTQENTRKRGRPRIDDGMEHLIIRLAKENLRWGYYRIEGELTKLGFDVSLTTVRNVLGRNGIVPAPVRFGSIGWKTMFTHYKQQLLACDFFVVESLFLRTYYCLFFIEIGTRRVHLAGVTANPNGQWVAQQARQYIWAIEEREEIFRCLIHDNDKKLTDAFDGVFQSKQIQVIHTPIEAPNANSFAERWVRSVRQECLDHVLILSETHLRRVLQTYIDYYNTRRPHQSLEQQAPIPYPDPTKSGTVKCRQLLGGIINDYYRVSGSTSLSPQLS